MPGRLSFVQAMRRDAQVESWALRLDGTAPRPHWQERAACRDEPPVTFQRSDTFRAEWLCRCCPVRLDCLRDSERFENATYTDRRDGIFFYRAGFPPADRRRIYNRVSS